MSAPRFSLRPVYGHWYDYLDLNNWSSGTLDSVIEKACHQAYRWSIPSPLCIRDIRARIFIELGRDVPALRVYGFYNRARRKLVTEMCAHFGLITREGSHERQ